MNRALCCIHLVALIGAPALAQEKFTIRLKTNAKGDIIQVSEKLAFTEKSTLTVMDKPQLTDKDKIWFGAFTEEIIEKEPGKMPTKLKVFVPWKIMPWPIVHLVLTRHTFGCLPVID